jgi:hypothetical protein
MRINEATEERVGLLEQSLSEQFTISQGLHASLGHLLEAVENLSARVKALEMNNPRGNPSGLLHFDK